MNTPYTTAAEWFDFWDAASRTLGVDLSVTNADECIVTCREYRDNHDLVTKDVTVATYYMLARCVLWLAERNRSLAMRSTGGWYFPVHGGHDAFDTKGDCIFTAHKQAVLAVDGEGDKQWQ